MSRLATTRSDNRMRPRLSILTQTLTRHIIASYYFQSLIELPNLLLAIYCYKFHISKDQQENMKSQLQVFIIWSRFYLYIVSDKKAAKWQIIVNFMFSN